MNKEVDRLGSVKFAFENRRKTRKKQGKVPDYLWKQVRSLTDNYSLTKICTSLIHY
jgi:hypothetical protein